MLKIAIVDDRPANIRILEEKLKNNKFFLITLKASNGEEFLQKMKALHQNELPDVVMMDLEMPVLDGVAAIGIGSSLYPDVKYVVLTVFDDDDKIFKAIRSGACGYLLKDESSDTIAEMLMNLYESGSGPISPSIAYKILQMVQKPSPDIIKTSEQETDQNLFHLSEREYAILQLLGKGMEYKEIAGSLFISPNTVKKHTVNIYQKLHVNSKAQALRIAYLKGMI